MHHSQQSDVRANASSRSMSPPRVLGLTALALAVVVGIALLTRGGDGILMGANATPNRDVSAADAAKLLGDLASDVAETRACAAAALGQDAFRSREVRDRLAVALDDDSAWVRAEAAGALAHLRSNTPDSVERLIELLSDDHWYVARRAANALASTPEQSLSGLRAAMDTATDKNRDGLATALRRMGSQAMPILSGVLTSDNESAVRVALRAMHDSQTDASSAFDAVTKIVERTASSDVRSDAVIAFGAMKQATARVLPKLDALIQQRETSYAAATAYKALGDAAKPSLPAMLRALRNERESNYTLHELIGSFGEDAVPGLRTLLRNRNQKTLEGVLRALRTMGRKGHHAIPDVIRLLDHRDPSFIMTVVNTLNELGPRSVAEILSVISPTSRIGTVRQAMRLLNFMGKKTVKGFALALERGSWMVRAAAAKKLVELGEDAIEAAPTLRRMLNSKDEYVRALSAAALVSMGRHVRDAIPQLVEGIRMRDGNVVRICVDAAARLRVSTPELVAALEDRMGRGSTKIGQSARTALISIGNPSQALVRQLIRDLSGKEGARAARTLARIGPVSAEVASALRRAIERGDASTAAASIRALSKMGPFDDATRRLITEKMADREPQVSGAAVDALAESMSADELLLFIGGNGPTHARVALAVRWARASKQPAPASLSTLVHSLFKSGKRKSVRQGLYVLDALGPRAVPCVLAAIASQEEALQDGGIFFFARAAPDLRDINIDRAWTSDELVAYRNEVSRDPLRNDARAMLLRRTKATEAPKRGMAALALAFFPRDATTIERLSSLVGDANGQVKAISMLALLPFNGAIDGVMPRVRTLTKERGLPGSIAKRIVALKDTSVQASDRKPKGKQPKQAVSVRDQIEQLAVAKKAGSFTANDVESLLDLLNHEGIRVGDAAASYLPDVLAAYPCLQPLISTVVVEGKPFKVGLALDGDLARVESWDTEDARRVVPLLENAQWGRRSAAIAIAAAAALSEARPVFLNLLKHEDAMVAENAAQALRRYRDLTQSDVEALIQALARPRLRRKVLDVLASLGSKAVSAVPEILSLLDAGRETDASLRALGTIGDDRLAVRRRILELYRRPEHRDAAIDAARKIASTSPAAQEVFSELLTAPSTRR